MLVDAVVGLLGGVIAWLGDLLPEVSLSLPDISPITTRIAELDSLVPIAIPIQAVAAMLPLLIVFVLFRLVILVRHILLP